MTPTEPVYDAKGVGTGYIALADKRAIIAGTLGARLHSLGVDRQRQELSHAAA